MKRTKFLLLSFFFFVLIFPGNAFGESLDFTSNHIEIKNDEALTNEHGYPVLRVRNNTDMDLDVTYSFYIKETDSSHFHNSFLVKAGEEKILKIPELSHLGSTNKTRTIWFNWSEPDELKPLQNQIETIPFKSKDSNETQLGFNY